MKGTTPNWKRPTIKTFEIESEHFEDINILDVLTATGMTQSKAEAKRIVQQNIIWIDNGVTDLDESTIWDRFTKVKLENSKMLLVEDSDIIGVGKTRDDAACHRVLIKRSPQIRKKNRK